MARLVAKFLGYKYIDSGAMYRAVTLKALQAGIDMTDPSRLASLAAGAALEFEYPGTGAEPVIWLDRIDVTALIRDPEVNRWVAVVAAVPEVRKAMVALQRRLAASGRVVMDGRDIGTNVLPEADRKFYLTASLEERARRRSLELEQKGYPVSREQTKIEIAERDRADCERPLDPLLKAPDAIVIDSTGRSVDEVVERILSFCRSRSESDEK